MHSHKTIKYEDTFLTLSHYKEPLTVVNKGYGYYGALLNTVDGEKVQCHVCGNLVKSLQAHAMNNHKLNSVEYKEKFQLAKQTSLISEKEREKRKLRTLAWRNSLSPDEKLERSRKSIEAYRKWQQEGSKRKKQPKQSLETYNKRGTCPDQLLAKIKECATNLGHSPSRVDFIKYCESQRFMHLIQATFGSWTVALKKAKLQPKERNTGGGQKKHRYSTEELIDYLQIFFQEHGKPPTESDAKRGLIPNGDIYRNRFGGIPAAREAAGIYQEAGRWAQHV